MMHFSLPEWETGGEVIGLITRHTLAQKQEEQ